MYNKYRYNKKVEQAKKNGKQVAYRDPEHLPSKDI
jgi:hypothetical protein